MCGVVTSTFTGWGFSLFFTWNLHLFPPYLDRICRFRVGVREVQGSRLIFLTGCPVRFILSAAGTDLVAPPPFSDTLGYQSVTLYVDELLF